MGKSTIYTWRRAYRKSGNRQITQPISAEQKKYDSSRKSLRMQSYEHLLKERTQYLYYYHHQHPQNKPMKIPVDCCTSKLNLENIRLKNNLLFVDVTVFVLDISFIHGFNSHCHGYIFKRSVHLICILYDY